MGNPCVRVSPTPMATDVCGNGGANSSKNRKRVSCPSYGGAPCTSRGSHMSQHARIAFSPKEAAELLDVTRQTIHALINKGTLRRFKVGSTTRIPAADVYALVGYEPHVGAAG